jgi:hypothetical protein
MDKKRLTIIIIFIAITVAIGYLLIRVFFSPATTEKKPITTTTTGQTGAFPTAQEGTSGLPSGEEAEPSLPISGQGTAPTGQTEAGADKIRQLVNNTIKSPELGTNGQMQYYNQLDGKFYRLDADGNPQLLSDEIFYQVEKVTWSPKKDEAILEYPDGNNIYYDFKTEQQATLPKHWQEFSFSSVENKIAAKSIGLSPENRWLITSDPDGKNITLVEPMGENADKIIIDWSPNNQIVALSLTGEPLGADRQELLFVGLNNENFLSTVVEGRGLKTKWSPDGKQLLYSVYNARNDYKPELWIVGAEGDTIGTNRRVLNVSTWADKCTFADERFVYCAVPTTLQRGAGFAPQLSDGAADTIYRIDTQTGLRTPLSMAETHTVDSLFISSDGKTLYFTDKQQTGLFSLSL